MRPPAAIIRLAPLMVVVQLAGLAHGVAEQHTLAGGARVHAAAATGHGHDASSLCAVTAHGEAHECTVGLSRPVRLVGPPAVAAPAPRARLDVPRPPRLVVPAREVLAVAPKASPPL